MDELKFDTRRDFIARQYASLVAAGADDQAARTRLREVLGDDAVAALAEATPEGEHAAGQRVADRLAEAARRLGANSAATQAACIRSLAEARLFALDWWRPIRTFLAYLLVLLGIAVVIALINAVFVLPAFTSLDTTMGMAGSGAAEWLTRKGELRLFAPLIVMAALLALLASRWWRMRQRIARLEPVAPSRFAWLHGNSDAAYRVLLCLEYASILKSGGAADAAALDSARQLAGWPAGTPLANDCADLGEHLEQAGRLGTFDAELDWQRRLHWSTTQSQLELSRDRLILAARVLSYILIGYMVTVLYSPIFTVASMIGVH